MLIKHRLEYFSSLIQMLVAINGELSYLKRSLIEVVNAEYQSAHFAKTVYSIYYSKNNRYYPKFLSIVEKEKLNTLFDALGKGDVLSQKALISTFLNEFSEIKREEEAVYKKNYSVYLRVGFLLGIILMIMVV